MIKVTLLYQKGNAMAAENDNPIYTRERDFPVLNVTCASCTRSSPGILENQPGILL